MRRLSNIIQMRKRPKPTTPAAPRGPIIDAILIWGNKYGVSTRALTELVLVLGEHGVDFKQPN